MVRIITLVYYNLYSSTCHLLWVFEFLTFDLCLFCVWWLFLISRRHLIFFFSISLSVQFIHWSSRKKWRKFILLVGQTWNKGKENDAHPLYDEVIKKQKLSLSLSMVSLIYVKVFAWDVCNCLFRLYPPLKTSSICVVCFDCVYGNWL